ncbi:MAG TPA: FCD domain-containing protein [Trebonia sp.]|jgi:DNA-binding FadR family transcriptional regulator
MGTTQAAPAKRGHELAELILAESGRAGLGPGSRLPTERRLAADLGVTRSGIRLALAALEADGLISREVGRGTFLRDAAADALAAARRGEHDASGASGTGTGASGASASAQDGAGPGGGDEAPGPRDRPAAPDFAPADVMTIRRLIEPQALPLVVLWATARDFAEMDRCVTGGDQAASYEEFESWDLALHRGIIAAAHSPLLAALYGVVESARHGQVWGDLKRRSATRQRRELYQQDHRVIVAALRTRDTDAAVEAMRTHLARVAGHLLGEAH